MPEGADTLTKYSDGAETRKVIFGKNITEHDILKALEFEIGWINQSGHKTAGDYARIKELTARLKNRKQTENAI